MQKIKKVLFVMASASTIPELSGKIAVPPAGMLSIAGYAKQFFTGVEFKLRDFGAERLQLEEQLRIIESIHPEIIGMAARSFIYPATVRLATLIKERLPETKIIFGGHHPSLMAENCDYPDCFDVVVRHEGEKAFVDLMKMYENGEIWPKKYSVGYLDDLSHDYSWDIIKYPEAYARFYTPFNTDPMGSVVWSRGCPFNCFFCSGPAMWEGSKPRVRYRSAQSIVNELRYIRDNFKVKRYFVHDDTINANLNKLEPILEEIIKSDLKMTWGAAGMRANKSMTPEHLFELMKRAGCRYVSFGIESGDSFVTEKLNRNVTFEEIERALALARKHGLRTGGGFTLGHIWLDENGQLDGEREEHLKKTVAYMKKLIDKRLLWSIQLSVIDPIPGSGLWNAAEKHGILLCDDWEYLLTYDRVKLNFKHPHLSPEIVSKYYEQGYRHVGMNLKHALFLLSTVRSFRDLYGLVRAGIFVWKSRLFKQ